MATVIGLHVQEAIALPVSKITHLSKRSPPGRRIRVIRKISVKAAHARRPPNLTREAFGSSAFSRSRSAQSASILSSIRCSKASAAARRDAGLLQLQYLPALPADLTAHTLDLGPDKSDVRHRSGLREARLSKILRADRHMVAEANSLSGQLRDRGPQAHQLQGACRAIPVTGYFGAHGSLGPAHLGP